MPRSRQACPKVPTGDRSGRDAPGSAPPLLYAAVAAALLAALAGWVGFALGQRSAGHDAAGEAEKRAVVAGP